MQTVRYDENYREEWNHCIGNSCNGTFLFNRAYMEYHKDKFEDCSLLFFNKNKLKGVLPASIKEKTIYSHGGLTYGGLVWDKSVSSQEVGEMLEDAILYYQENLHAEKLYYKPVPYIYHQYPASQDKFYLFSKGAIQTRCNLASVVKISDAIAFSTLRKRHLQKSQINGLQIDIEENENTWAKYWEMLSTILKDRHNSSPVHSVEEILFLKNKFPQNIKLVTVSKDTEIVGGTVLFITPTVIHTQYIAASNKGCETGALEFMFDYLLHSATTQGQEYFDFGTSMENGGKELSKGLNFQKEGMGGRGVCYEEYMLNLK